MPQRFKKEYFILLFLLCLTKVGMTQAYVVGRVLDVDTKSSVELVTVYVDGSQRVTETNVNGEFKIEIQPNMERVLVFKRIGYIEKKMTIARTPDGIIRRLDVLLIPENSDLEIVVTDSKIKDLGMIREDAAQIKLLPSVTGNLESALPSLALGVNMGNGGELTSQYSVRGGNYDENLVYVNDYEIYRPQLIRSGQQEGLSFPNPDLISSLSFSTGGFEAKYGDKLSSVLDIKYKRPTTYQSSVALSALGASVHTEGSLSQFQYILGARYKTNQYLLNSLETKGVYQPNHYDLQAYFTYNITDSWQADFLGNMNYSSYKLSPSSGKNAVGLVDFTVNLFTVYEGAEIDDFYNSNVGMSLTYLPNTKKNPFFLKFLTSWFQSQEKENFDILGYYRLSQIETSTKETSGREVALLGIGTQHNYGRNELNANVFNLQHKGGYELQLNKNGAHSHFFHWGVKLKEEIFEDDIKEWERLDSVGYSLPYSTDSVYIYSYLRTKNSFNNLRINGYLQDTYTKQDSVKELKITLGSRLSYTTYNEDFYITPRVQILYKPLLWKKDISFKLSTGLYYQPPFYREYRNSEGRLNNQLLSQKSFHVITGMTYDFKMENISTKPFKIITELYYKKLWDLVSYDIENVKIDYSGQNNARGYIYGIDFRINGEFVPNAESWFNISLLRARESIKGIQHTKFTKQGYVEVKDVPRPTDQLVFFNLFYEDYLPKFDRFKTNLLLAFGSGIAYGIKGDNLINRNPFRYAPYRRLDVGFSYHLWDSKQKRNAPNHPLRWTRNSWISLDVFNLLGVENVVSTTWIKSIYGANYGIPNRLTARRVNLKFRVEF